MNCKLKYHANCFFGKHHLMYAKVLKLRINHKFFKNCLKPFGLQSVPKTVRCISFSVA